MNSIRPNSISLKYRWKGFEFFEFYIQIWPVCLFVCLYPIKVKTAEPIGPTFFVGPHVTPGKVMNDQKFKNLHLKVFYFSKILKMREKIL